LLDVDFCIVGAGVSGLTLSHELVKAGHQVVLIERDDRVGGLAKSFSYNKIHTFDTGPKRFHTTDPEVINFLNEISDGSLQKINRKSVIQFKKKFFDWPLTSRAIFSLPITICSKAFFEIVFSKKKEAKNYEDLILNRYGKTLARSFFYPYTEKFLRTQTSIIHKDWAEVGVNRTAIDRKVTNILHIIRDLLPFIRKNDDKFLYPIKGGFGSFFDKVYKLVSNNENFNSYLGDEICSIQNEKNGLVIETKNGLKIKAQKMIWTGNINNLSQLVSQKNTGLNYINTHLYNFTIKGRDTLNSTQWLYVSDKTKMISRVSFPKSFSTQNAPDGYVNLTVEITRSESEGITIELDDIKQELIELGIVDRDVVVEDVNYQLVRDSYPIYDLGYREKYLKVVKDIKQFSSNVLLFGRSGAFWYNNSDHSIKMALLFCQNLMSKDIDIEEMKEKIFS
jgi:protoporphyrinogen oxidase